jgi:uncharacterized protein
MMKALLIALLLGIGIGGEGLAQTPPRLDELKAYTGFHAAAARGEVDAIKRFVREGRDINARDPFGRTPLMVAAFFKDLKAALALIKGGADLNLLEKDVYDALTISSVLNDLDMVKLLIKHGANAKLVTSPYDGTALIASTHLGHVGVVRELIKAGAPLDHINNLQWTALIEAIVLGDGGPNHVACVRLMVEAGADVNLADGDGTRPLGLAEQRGFKEMVSILKAAGGKP